MNNLLHKNSILLGVVATLATELLCAAVVWLALIVLKMPVAENARWFAAAFIPPLLLLRHYAKEREYPATLKAVISTFFVTFVAFMWFIIKYRYITF